MAETWEDCVALLRAGASPSDVLPKLRELINSEPPTSSSPMETDFEASELPTLRYKLDDVVLQLPYFQPPPSIWQALSNYTEEYCFDTEATVDVLGEFSPIFVGPPEEEIAHMLARINIASRPVDKSTFQEGFEHDYDTDFGANTTSSPRSKVVATLQKLTQDPSESIDFVFPLYLEAEWVLILSDLALERVDPKAVSNLVRNVNQPQFSRVVLRSILPILSHDMETEAFLDIVTLVASSADVSSMTSRELTNVMSFYRGIPSKGALAQLRILCSVETQL